MQNDKIKIDDTSRVLIDDNNYTLQYKVKKGDFGDKKGTGFKWELGGYFPDMGSLLQDWVKNAPVRSKSSLKSLQDVVDCIRSAEKHIERLLK